MSITGAPTAPLPPGRRDLRYRQRHVCGAGCCIRLVRAGADGQGATRRYWNARSHGCVADLPGGHLLRDRIDTGAHGESASHDRAYETFAAADGEFVIAVGNDDEQWKRFCGVMGATDLEADERFATNRGRVSHHTTLRPSSPSDFAPGTGLTGQRAASRRRPLRVGARHRRSAVGSHLDAAGHDPGTRMRPRAPSRCLVCRSNSATPRGNACRRRRSDSTQIGF